MKSTSLFIQTLSFTRSYHTQIVAIGNIASDEDYYQVMYYYLVSYCSTILNVRILKIVNSISTLVLWVYVLIISHVVG